MRMLLRNGEQLLLTVVIPRCCWSLFGTGERSSNLGAGSRDRLPGARRARAGGHVDRLHRRRPSPPASSGATACSSGSAPRRCRARACWRPRRWRCWPSRCCRSSLLAASRSRSAGRRTASAPCSPSLLLLLGTAAFARSALLMAGTLRAEATLAAANLVYLLLLVGGGVVVPLDKFPGGDGGGGPAAAVRRPRRGPARRPARRRGPRRRVGPALVLLVWGVAATALAARTFRWE